MKDIFANGAKGAAGAGETEGQLRVIKKEDLRVILRETPGYENIRSNEFNYVLDEAGFSKREAFDFDEFVEVGSRKKLLIGSEKTLILSPQICAG